MVPYEASKSTQGNQGREILSQVEDIVNNLKEKGEVILCGDFNSRIGRQAGMIKNDSNKFLPLSDDYECDEFKPRNSQDLKNNSHGPQFVKLITHTQLKILNGRTLGDFEGKYTSIQRNGCSVIDYFAVTSKINKNVNYFKVAEFTAYSDHKPIIMEMRCNNLKITPHKPLHQTYQKAPTRFIFNEENKSKFIESMSDQESISMLKNLKKDISVLHEKKNEQTQDNISQSLKTINEKFTKHIRENAAKAFDETKDKSQNKHTNNKPWFNWQTRQGKRLLRNATQSTSSFPTSEFLRENFYKVKGSYKRLLSKCETKYFENLNKDIEGEKF